MKRIIILIFIISSLSSYANLQFYHEVTKKVEVKGLLGKGVRYRYFFIFKASKPASKSIKLNVKLLTKKGDGLMGKTFTINKGQQGGWVSVDEVMGPKSVHGDAGAWYAVLSNEDLGTTMGKVSIKSEFTDLTK